MEVVIVGAGVAGLASALELSRHGHHVTIVERDATPLPEDAAGAFAWDRRGAPQVRHSHAFLARLRNLLRDHHPDVLDALYAAGATDMDFIATLPEGMDRTPMDGDADLIALACRRTTFEWVLRRTVLADPNVALHDDVAVTGVVGQAAAQGSPAVVRGVALADGSELRADLVVEAGGRRANVPALLAPLGVTIDEHEEDTGIIYTSRFFELLDGQAYPEQVGPIGGDLGYLKYGVFPGDNRTFSITFATAVDDDELRHHLLDPEMFLLAAAQVPATASYVDGRAVPITEVNVMARLLNRRRTFVDEDGRPLVEGFVAVGDAHTCTNPLYGRGCSLSMVQAHLLGAAADAHPSDPGALGAAYEAASRDEILPWYRASVTQDASNRKEAARLRQATQAAPDDGAEEDPMRALLRDGLLPALRVDPVVLRAFLRMFNLLEAPDHLMTNWDVIGRVMKVYQDRDERPPEPSLGPDRAGLLAAIA